jgi:hypothetical protein
VRGVIQLKVRDVDDVMALVILEEAFTDAFLKGPAARKLRYHLIGSISWPEKAFLH